MEGVIKTFILLDEAFVSQFARPLRQRFYIVVQEFLKYMSTVQRKINQIWIEGYARCKRAASTCHVFKRVRYETLTGNALQHYSCKDSVIITL